MNQILKVVVAGEVDAGKSTLIGRLLFETGSLHEGIVEDISHVSRSLGNSFEFAYLLDSFEEERQGRLTIDTTQVFCNAGRDKQLVLIDVPGHRELMSNMLSGSSFADTAVLVVDIQRLITIDTLRHAWILKFLGIDSVIVAMNKLDSSGFSRSGFTKASAQVSHLLEQNAMTCDFIVPLSARQGDNLVKRSKNMPWYRGPVLFDLLKAGFKKRAHRYFRMPIQDSYSIDNGEFLVGTILGGAIARKERVYILPSGRKCIVRSLRTFTGSVQRLSYPQSIGVQLEDGPGICRGQVMCKPPLPRIGNEVRVKIFCVSSLRSREHFTLRCAAQEVAARLADIDAVRNIDDLKPKNIPASFEPGDIIDAVIRTELPLVYDTLQQNNSLSRFIIHQSDGICAFGLVESKRA